MRRNGRWRGNSLDATSRASAALGDRLLEERPRDPGERREGGVQVHEQRGLLLGHRRHLAGGVAQRREEAVEPGLGAGQVARPRARGPRAAGAAPRSPCSGSAPRPARPSPKPFSDRCEPVRVGSSNMLKHLVDLDRLGRGLRERHDRAGREARLGAAGRQLHVLEAERRARAHEEGRVDRQRLEVLVELQLEPRRVASPSSLRHRRRSRRSRRRARRRCAPRCPRTRLAAFGSSRLQVVGGHERQAGVGVVGEEDRDDRDQQRHRADQHRAARRVDAPAAARSSLVSQQVVEHRLLVRRPSAGDGLSRAGGGAARCWRSRSCGAPRPRPGRASRSSRRAAWAARCRPGLARAAGAARRAVARAAPRAERRRAAR